MQHGHLQSTTLELTMRPCQSRWTNQRARNTENEDRPTQFTNGKMPEAPACRSLAAALRSLGLRSPPAQAAAKSIHTRGGHGLWLNQPRPPPARARFSFGRVENCSWSCGQQLCRRPVRWSANGLHGRAPTPPLSPDGKASGPLPSLSSEGGARQAQR